MATYDLQPEMSAYEVADEVCGASIADKYDVIILNFANCDMVGHTGVFERRRKGRGGRGRVCRQGDGRGRWPTGGTVLRDGRPRQCREDVRPETRAPLHRAHHQPRALPSAAGLGDVKLRQGGVLADIAPTMLKVMGLPQPEEMTGKSIIE